MNFQKIKHPSALTVAGSDSGGGAGVQADLRTFSYFRVFGTSVITAVTAQNPLSVKAVVPLNKKSVADQLEAVFSEISLNAVKTGMLYNASIINTISDFLHSRKLDSEIAVIVDPVMISSSGALLLRDEKAVRALKDNLFPIADWITPNIEETEKILNLKIHNIEDCIIAAKTMSEKWGNSCIIKGGHKLFQKNKRTDIVCSSGKIYAISSPDVKTSNFLSHGTGCTLSAALAANFAKGCNMRDTLIRAKAFVYNSLLNKVRIGKNIDAMFPPEKNCIKEIKFCQL